MWILNLRVGEAPYIFFMSFVMAKITLFLFSVGFFFCEYNILDFSPLCRILKVLHFGSSQKFGEFSVN